MKTILQNVCAVALVGSLISANATVFYFLRTTSSEFADPTDPAVWSTNVNDIGGSRTDGLLSVPGARDDVMVQPWSVKESNNSRLHLALDMGGGTFTFNAHTNQIGGVVDVFKPNFKNGTVECNLMSFRCGTITVQSDATFRILSNGTLALGLIGTCWQKTPVYNNGTMEFMSGSTFDMRSATLNNSGLVVFNNAVIRNWGANNNMTAQIFNNNGGTLRFLNGTDFTVANLEFEQRVGGTIELSGTAKSTQSGYTVPLKLNGGTVRALADAMLQLGATSVESGASVRFEAVDDSILRADEVSFGAGATITLGGDGCVVLSSLPDALVFDGGRLGLSAAEFDIADLAARSTVSDQMDITFFNAGVNVTGQVPDNFASVVFAVDKGAIVDGAPIATFESVAMLESAYDSISEQLAGTYNVTKSGMSLYASKISDYTFNKPSVSDLWNDAGWVGGYVPVGETVYIEGEGVVARVSATGIPAFSAIVLRDGASIEVSANEAVSLGCPITINPGTSFVVKSGTTCSVEAGFTTVAATVDAMPTVVVEDGATLQLPSTLLNNASYDIKGTLSASSSNWRIGCVEGADPVYVAFCLDGANATLSGLSSDSGSLTIGTGIENLVNIKSPISFKNLGNRRPFVGGDIIFGGSKTACNGVAGSNRGRILIENSYLSRGNQKRMDICYFDVTLDKAGLYGRINGMNGNGTISSDGNDGRFVWIGDSACIRLVNGARYEQSQTYENNQAEYCPSTMQDVFVVSNSVVMACHANGYGRACAEFYNADLYTKGYGTAFFGNFCDFADIRLPEGSVVNIRGKDSNKTTAVFFGSSFSGKGSIAVKDITAVFADGNSTCTGTLRNDSANPMYISNFKWAGTIRASANGNTYTANYTRPSKTHMAYTPVNNAISKNYIGEIALDGDMHIRLVQTASDGLQSDQLYLTGAGFTGSGSLVMDCPVSADYSTTHDIVIGTIPQDTAIPNFVGPQVSGRRWALVVEPLEDNPTTLRLIARDKFPTMIILR